MLEGVLGPEGTASEIERPRLHPRRQDRHRPGRRNGGYSKTKYVASFIGFAPALHPKFLAAVIVDQPEGEIYGGSVAAPAFAEIAAFSFLISVSPRNSVMGRRSRGASGDPLVTPSAGCGEGLGFGECSQRLPAGAPDALPRLGFVTLEELVQAASGAEMARVVGDGTVDVHLARL